MKLPILDFGPRFALSLRGGRDEEGLRSDDNTTSENALQLRSAMSFLTLRNESLASLSITETPFCNISEDELCMLNGNITTDGGIRVLLERKGDGWRKPSPSDEVLIIYKGRCNGVEFTSSKGPTLVQLGQNMLPHGLETAIVTSFTRHSSGKVFLSSKYAQGTEIFLNVTSASEIEYELQLLDWNDVWYSPDGRVIFRGLGQPANHSATAGDSDRVFLKADAHFVARHLDPLSKAECWKETDSLMPECEMIAHLGCGQFEPPALEQAMQRLRPGQTAHLWVSGQHAFGLGASVAMPTGAVGVCGENVAPPAGAFVRYRVTLMRCEAADELPSSERALMCRMRIDRGNEHYARGGFRDALECYGKALLLLGACADDQGAVNASAAVYMPTAAGDELRRLEVACLMNAAGCQMRWRRGAAGGDEGDRAAAGRAAAAAMERVLRLEPGNAKALLRKSEAFEMLHDLPAGGDAFFDHE